MKRVLDDQGVTLGRKAVRAVNAANSVGIPMSDIQASLLDAAARTRASGNRKIGSFGLSRHPIEGLRSQALSEKYRQELDKRLKK
ncbi:MAG: hypothetical protein ACM3IJ_03245 [Candidatus Levyibacteriota bacterium]